MKVVFYILWVIIFIFSNHQVFAQETKHPTKRITTSKKYSKTPKHPKKIKRIIKHKKIRKIKKILPITVKKRHPVVHRKTKIIIHKKRVVQKTVNPPVYIPTFSHPAHLSGFLNNMIDKEGVNTAVGVYVKSMKTGEILFSRHIHASFSPASISKIFTAEAALIYLGNDYRFSTQLLTNAKSIKNGILQGDLYILLSGDPTLTYTNLIELMTKLEERGIQAISGNVYIDNTAYDQSFYGPGWEYKDKQYCYGAPISAGIVNRNCLSFQIRPGHKPGYAAELHTSPKYFYPGINNAVVTKTRYSRGCRLHIEPGKLGTIELTGCIPTGRYRWGVSYVVSDVPEYNRKIFKEILRDLGIRVYGTTTFKTAPKHLAFLGGHVSKPLKELIHEMLKKSDNVIAGALFKKMGQLYTHQSGSWANGSFAVSQILKRRTGLNLSNLKILDGSGVSPDNLATPYQLMQILHFSYHDVGTKETFITSLPIAGVDGTLKMRMKNITRKVRAKTGTISGVVSLAGYVQTANNEPLAFVIMINGSKGLSWRYRTLEDNIVTMLAKFKR